MDFKNKEKVLTVRERIVFILTMFLIQMIHPWEYSHEYTKYWNSLKNELGVNEEDNKKKK